MSKGKFRIQTVAEMTGVPASTLRTWEQRYGFPSPDRTASAYRMYSQDDIDRIGKVRELCEQGLGPAEAVKQILTRHGDFVSDPAMEKYSLTFNPNGYLRRVG